MKMLKTITALGLTAAYLAAPLVALADDKKETAKPYPLDKCIVSDEKLGEMGKPFVFTYEGQEIKLCCKSCKKDFTSYINGKKAMDTNTLARFKQVFPNKYK